MHVMMQRMQKWKNYSYFPLQAGAVTGSPAEDASVRMPSSVAEAPEAPPAGRRALGAAAPSAPNPRGAGQTSGPLRGCPEEAPGPLLSEWVLQSPGSSSVLRGSVVRIAQGVLCGIDAELQAQEARVVDECASLAEARRQFEEARASAARAAETAQEEEIARRLAAIDTREKAFQEQAGSER